MDYHLIEYKGKVTLECSNCLTRIYPGDQYFMEDTGTIICSGCFDHAFPKCEFCGKRVPGDDMLFWGDCYCCPDCYEDFNPSFDPEENERETTQAYEAMLKKYIGQKSKTIRNDNVELELENVDCGYVIYRMNVDFDEEGIITDISRLTADILIGESQRSESWEEYIIRNEDYEDKVVEMMKSLDLVDFQTNS